MAKSPEQGRLEDVRLSFVEYTLLTGLRALASHLGCVAMCLGVAMLKWTVPMSEVLMVMPAVTDVGMLLAFTMEEAIQRLFFPG